MEFVAKIGSKAARVSDKLEIVPSDTYPAMMIGRVSGEREAKRGHSRDSFARLF